MICAKSPTVGDISPAKRPTLSLKGASPTAVDHKPQPKSLAVDVPLELFWLVWAPSRRRPQYRHPSQESALAEAARLRGANPGTTFYVFEARLVGEAARQSR